MNWLTDEFWTEVRLRALNNWEFSTGEQLESNVNKAIQEIAEEAKISNKAKAIVGEWENDNN